MHCTHDNKFILQCNEFHVFTSFMIIIINKKFKIANEVALFIIMICLYVAGRQA